jgi:hypothetical protein
MARDRVDALLEEEDEVSSTLTRAAEWEQSYQTGDRSARDKKRSQERLELVEKSRAALPTAVANAKAARKDLDPDIEALRKRYAQTMEALEKNLEAQQAAK